MLLHLQLPVLDDALHLCQAHYIVSVDPTRKLTQGGKGGLWLNGRGWGLMKTVYHLVALADDLFVYLIYLM